MPRTEYFVQPYPPIDFELANGVILKSNEFDAAVHALSIVATGLMHTPQWCQRAEPFIVQTLELYDVVPPRSCELAAALITSQACGRIASRLGYFSRSQKAGDSPTIGARSLARAITTSKSNL